MYGERRGDHVEKVLITGATGLIGNALLSMLEGEYECWVLGRHAVSSGEVHFIEQDIGRPFDFEKLPEQMDYIFIWPRVTPIMSRRITGKKFLASMSTECCSCLNMA